MNGQAFRHLETALPGLFALCVGAAVVGAPSRVYADPVAVRNIVFISGSAGAGHEFNPFIHQLDAPTQGLSTLSDSASATAAGSAASSTAAATSALSSGRYSLSGRVTANAIGNATAGATAGGDSLLAVLFTTSEFQRYTSSIEFSFEAQICPGCFGSDGGLAFSALLEPNDAIGPRSLFDHFLLNPDPSGPGRFTFQEAGILEPGSYRFAANAATDFGAFGGALNSASLDYNVSLNFSPVAATPEPMTLALLSTAFVVFGRRAWRSAQPGSHSEA
jgi:hypothetical protein